MKYPAIASVKPMDNHILLVEFVNKERRIYDVTPLLGKEMFIPLKDPRLFKNVQVERGGYAVLWNEEIDISEYELWKNGISVS